MTGPIYAPKGRAAEYSHLALNTYIGCGHQCTYCYIQTKYKRKPVPRPRPQVLEKLKEQVEKTNDSQECRVLLSFACDPYQPLEETARVTHDALIILGFNGVPFQVLTKSYLAVRDFNLYGSSDAFAVTLSLLDDKWQQFEPFASNPQDRMLALYNAKECGIETWVSLEPVLDPVQSLEVIRQTHTYVDLYKIGKLNYQQPPEPIDWRKFAIEAINLCDELGKPYFIKSDLAHYIEDVPFTNTDNRRADWKSQTPKGIEAAKISLE